MPQSIEPVFVYMNQNIKDAKCRAKGSPCIAVQIDGKTVNVHAVSVYHENELICTVSWSNKANPDIKNHTVHAWVEVEPDMDLKFG